MSRGEWQACSMTDEPVDPQMPRDGDRERKFFCVVDSSPECAVAVQFASRRAKHTGGRVVLLFVIEPGDFEHWASVKDIMREEAREEAEEVLRAQAERVERVSGTPAELVIREGKIQEEIRALIDADPSIGVLVLGSAVGKEGPGPLVSLLAGRDAASRFPIPVTVVPGHLSDEEINALA